MSSTTATAIGATASLAPAVGDSIEPIDEHPDRPLAAGCDCCEPTQYGQPWQLGTAAFWVQQAREFTPGPAHHRLGRTLREEIAACMLGGYGIPGPVGNAAFAALRDAGLLTTTQDEGDLAELIAEALATPLPIGGGRTARYRFHQQRPRRLAAALAALDKWEVHVNDLTDVALRNKLTELPGVGPKTASWIVRNHRGSDAVAIIDIHIRRAGLTAGAFCQHWTLPRDYHRFEMAFLSWAHTGLVSAANLDATIWQLLSALGRHGQAITDRSTSTNVATTWAGRNSADPMLFAL